MIRKKIRNAHRLEKKRITATIKFIVVKQKKYKNKYLKKPNVLFFCSQSPYRRFPFFSFLVFESGAKETLNTHKGSLASMSSLALRKPSMMNPTIILYRLLSRVAIFFFQKKRQGGTSGNSTPAKCNNDAVSCVGNAR